MTELPDVVDEWIYLAADDEDGGRHALVSGLTIQRQPDRFRPLLSLNTLLAAADDTAAPS